jgi:adenine-specific DNA-methyltransferase
MVQIPKISHEPDQPELRWKGRTQRAISAEGRYALVPPAKLEESAPRTIRQERWYGEGDGANADANLMIEGDAADALQALIRAQPREGRRPMLAYLDPPFNTQNSFADYHDALDHAVWLTMIRDRLELIIQLLADDGSIWVQCDDREQAYLRVLMDELLGRDAFIGTIVWQRRYSRDNRPALGAVHDYIHIYSPIGIEWKNVRNRLPRTDSDGHWQNPDNDPRGPWNTHALVAQGGHGTPAQFYAIRTPSGKVVEPPPGSCWRVTKERFEELVTEGKIWFGAKGSNVPRKKVFQSEAKGLVPWSWWPHNEVGHNQESRLEIRKLLPDVPPFTTPKPERLMERIIHIATQPGDLVLDCFLGSGTTAAVAQKMHRSWIGVELSRQTIETFALPRLQAVVEARDPGGVTKSTGWPGGGGFWLSAVEEDVASGVAV